MPDVARLTELLLANNADGARALAATLARDPNVATRSAAGGVLVAGGLFAEGRQILESVLQDAPRDRNAHIAHAAACFKLGDIEPAVAGCTRAFELDPTDLTPIHNLMEMLAELGKWSGAFAALGMLRETKPPADIALALDVASVQIIYNMIGTFPAAGADADTDKTVRDLVGGVKARGARMQLTAARLLVDVDRIADARNLVQQVARNPMLAPADRADLHYTEGAIAEYDDYRTTAIEKYTKAVAADPTHTGAATSAVSLLLELGTPEALAQIGALLEQVDREARNVSAPLAFNESRYLVKLGRTDDARAALTRVIEVAGAGHDLTFLAQRALVELGT